MEKIPTPENNIETQIEQLLSKLDDYALDQFSEEIQDRLEDEWYVTEMEAQVGADRAKALENLRIFLEKLSQTPKKQT